MHSQTDLHLTLVVGGNVPREPLTGKQGNKLPLLLALQNDLI